METEEDNVLHDTPARALTFIDRLQMCIRDRNMRIVYGLGVLLEAILIAHCAICSFKKHDRLGKSGLLGTFDPIHMGHLYMITSVLNENLVDEVVVVPTMQNVLLNYSDYVHRDLIFTGSREKLYKHGNSRKN